MDGYSCLHCDYFCGCRHSANVHFIKEHCGNTDTQPEGLPRSLPRSPRRSAHRNNPVERFTQVPVQQLYVNPSAKTYIPVILPSAYPTAQTTELDTLTDTRIAELSKQVADDISVLSLDPKNMDAWVKKARWHLIRERPGFAAMAELLRTIEPDEHRYHALRKVAVKAIKCVNSFIDGASLYFLRGIGNNMSGEAADIFVNCWRPIRESFKAYSDTMAKLLYAVILAADCNIKTTVLGLHGFQQKSARRLKEHLDVVAKSIVDTGNIGVETEQLFWALAIDMFTYSFRKRDGSPYQHPVYAFVSLLAFKNNSFSHANEHREFVCRLIFWGRASVCLAMRNVAGSIAAVQPSNIANTRTGSAHLEQLLDKFALVNRSSDAYKQLDITIYRPGYEHPEPQEDPSLVVGIEDAVNSVRPESDPCYDHVIANSDRLWCGMHSFLEDSKPVPIGALFALYGLLSGSSDGCIKGPIIYWKPNSDYHEMLYRNATRVHIQHLANAYVDAIDRIKKLLKELLVLVKNTTLPKLIDLVDNCNEPNNQFSFMTNPANKLGQHGMALFRALVADGKFRATSNSAAHNVDGSVAPDSTAFNVDGTAAPGSMVFSMDGMVEWQSKVFELIKLFLFAMHLSGGQPARATELNTLMVEEWDIQRRGLYIVHGHMAMATRYWKGQALHGHDKYILRLLPDELGELLLKYLVFIKPCEVMVVGALCSNRPDNERSHATTLTKYYLFTRSGRRFSDKNVRDIFAQQWMDLVGFKLTFQDMRHIMQAFLVSNCHKFHTSAGSVLVDDTSENHYDSNLEYPELARQAQLRQDRFGAIAAQAGHTARVAELHYAISNEGIRIIMEQQLLANCKTSLLWHALLLTNVAKPNLPFEWSRIPYVAREKLSVYVHAVDHALADSTGKNVMVKLTQTFQLYNSVYPEPPPSSSSSSSSNTAVRRGQGDICLDKRKFVQQQLVRYSLRTDISTFKSQQQKDSICRLIEGERDVLVVLPTGGGKSFIFQLASLIDAAIYPGRFTLVVSPLKVLTQNIRDECLKHNVPCKILSLSTFGFLQPGTFSGLLVVSVENLKEPDITNFLANCATQNYLHRVVVDEAHLYPAWKDFRNSMSYVKTAISFAKQLVLFSATVPPHTELKLFDHFRIGSATRRENVDIVRAPTVRPNITYSIRMCHNGGEAMRALADTVTSALIMQDAGDLCIVYCLTLGEVTKVYDMLKAQHLPGAIEFYHGQLDDKEQMRVYSRLLRREVSVVVATCALGT
ncbi:hypothetical protein H4S02_001808, partial [Coemansia sp. RSA 2611]